MCKKSRSIRAFGVIRPEPGESKGMRFQRLMAEIARFY